MKSKLKIMGIIFLLILTTTIGCYANTDKVSLTANLSKNEVLAGETFTLTLNIKSEDGINGVSGSYSYDTEKLELLNATQGTGFANLGSGKEIALISTDSTSIKEADVYTLTFKVKDGVAAGSEAKISLAETIIDTDEVENSIYKVSPKDMVIKVKASTPEQQECEHTYGKYSDNGNGTHSAHSAKCEIKNTGKHKYENGKCTLCNAKEPLECKHERVYYNNNVNGTHTSVCIDCGEKIKTEAHSFENGECICSEKEDKPITKCEHTYSNYTDNKDGKHSATCTKCQQKLTEEHTYENGVCSKCKVKQVKNPEGEKEQKLEENKKDETTAEKEIPKAGLETMLTFVMIAIATAVIMYRKNKKYEDIK